MSKIKKTLFILSLISISSINSIPVSRIFVRAMSTFSKREISKLVDALEFIKNLETTAFYPSIISNASLLSQDLNETNIILSEQEKKDLDYYLERLSRLNLENKSIHGKSCEEILFKLRALKEFYNKGKLNTKKIQLISVTKEIDNLLNLFNKVLQETLSKEFYTLCDAKEIKKIKLSPEFEHIYIDLKEKLLDAQAKLNDIQNTQDDKSCLELSSLHSLVISALDIAQQLLGEGHINIQEITETETA